MTRKEFFDAFVARHLGIAIDADGVYPGECVDLFKQFMVDVGMPNGNKALGGTGYAKEIYLRRNELGYMKYFTEHTVAQYGDWFIWNNCAHCPYSHVAMFIKDLGNGCGVFLGQNQGGKHEATEISIPYASSFNCLRLKDEYIPNGPAFPKSGTFKFTCDGVRIRLAPSLSGKIVSGVTYDTNETVIFINTIEADGYLWLEYVRSAGGKGYVSAGPIATVSGTKAGYGYVV